MDDEQEQELWRLRSVEYDLDALQAQHDELKERHYALLKKAEEALEAVEKAEAMWTPVKQDNERLRRELQASDEKLEAQANVLKELKRQLRHSAESKYMENTYGFKVTKEMPSRRGWRLSR